MNKTIAIGIVALFVCAAIPSAESSRSETAVYYPNGSVQVRDVAGAGPTVSCSGQPHNLVPIGPPPADPTDLSGWESWVFSGEPECAPTDALNAATGNTEKTGFGGAYYDLFPGDELAPVVAANLDDVFGAGESYLILRADSRTAGNSVRVEGCGGSVAGQIPADPAIHWQSVPGNEMFLYWVFVRTVGVDSDLSVCLSSTGTVTATVG